MERLASSTITFTTLATFSRAASAAMEGGGTGGHSHASRPHTSQSGHSSDRSGQGILVNLVSQDWRKRVKEEAKLFLLTVPSLVVIVALCGLSLKAASDAISLQTTLQGNVQDAQSIGQLASVLQRERGRTCVYATLKKVFGNQSEYDQPISDAEYSMLRMRSEADASLRNIKHWLGETIDGPEYEDKDAFNRSLNSNRVLARSDQTDCEFTLRYYSGVGQKLMEQLSRPFRKTEDGRFWSLVEAYHSLLLTKDYLGLQRALGRLFFAKTSLSDSFDLSAFAKVVGASEQLLELSINHLPDSGAFYYEEMANSSALIANIDEMRREILDSAQQQNQSSHQPDDQKALDWFRNLTAYLSLIENVDRRISDAILYDLNLKSNAKKFEYYSTIGAVVAVLLLCPPITCWYALKSQSLMKKVDLFVKRLTVQMNELKVEKQKTDLLLYQLLPKTVAMELKQNKMVAPEHYEEATVYFSDIQGFTTLATRSTPMQVIAFLNQLYTKCDQILDQNDVYKVETIGDAYMVVSGVPRKNEKNHSAEMASAALNILMAMEEFFIPHMPDQRLLMRIGIHTGPVAAGVVGNKMPRYCLFGDTVTTASKMEATSQALRIHLSPWTNEHLHKWHPGRFETIERGPVDIKSKGVITTYWLTGKQGLPFRVELDRTEEIVARTTYWRT